MAELTPEELLIIKRRRQQMTEAAATSEQLTASESAWLHNISVEIDQGAELCPAELGYAKFLVAKSL